MQLSVYVNASSELKPSWIRKAEQILYTIPEGRNIHNELDKKLIPQRSTEAEYLNVLEAYKVIAWLKRLLEELNTSQKRSWVFQNSRGATELACKSLPRQFNCRRYVDVLLCYVNQMIKNAEIKIV